MGEKEHINLVVIGDVDAGKSTIAAELNSRCRDLSWHTMAKAPSELGITVCNFETPRHYVTLNVVPGHRDFIENMISGTSQTDCAVLVIDASEGGIVDGGQTREHALIARVLGVGKLVVVVNKMDNVEWSESRFNAIINKTAPFMVGRNPINTQYIPVSGKDGDNLIDVSQQASWYQGWEHDGHRKTLLDAIDAMEPRERDHNKPLRIPVQNVYNIPGNGTVVVGRVEAGIINARMVVTFAPANVTATVKSVEMYDGEIVKGLPGDNGVCCGNVVGDSKNDPPKRAMSFTAQIVVLKDHGEIRAGYAPVLDCRNAHITCKFTKILKTIDPRTGDPIEENPDFIKVGDHAEVNVVPSENLCVDKYSDYPSLGLFVFCEGGGLIGCGKIMSVISADEEVTILFPLRLSITNSITMGQGHQGCGRDTSTIQRVEL